MQKSLHRVITTRPTQRPLQRGYVICSATTIVFSVPKRLKAGQQMKVMGNVASMGEWNRSKAVALEQSVHDCWFTEVDVAPGQRVEYKFFAESDSSQETCEEQPVENLYVDIPPGTEGAELIITDSWEGKKRAVSWQGLLKPLTEESRLSSDSDTTSSLQANGSSAMPLSPGEADEESSAPSSSIQSEASDSDQVQKAAQGTNGQILPVPSESLRRATEDRNDSEPRDLQGSMQKGVSSQRRVRAIPRSGTSQRPGGVKAGRVSPARNKSTGDEDEEELESMTTKGLRAILKGLGLPVKRRKADMIQDIRQKKD